MGGGNSSAVVVGRKPYPHEIAAKQQSSTLLEADNDLGTSQENPYDLSIPGGLNGDHSLSESPANLENGGHSMVPGESTGIEVAGLVDGCPITSASGRPNDVSLIHISFFFLENFL